MTTQTTPPGAGIRQWMGLTVLALPTLVLALDMSVLYLAAPAMTVDLRASSTEQLWIIDIYGFMIAGFLITMGTLGDRIGRRKLLMIGGIVFALASLAAAFAPSAPILIAARALLGVAGATLMPSTLALITNMFTVPRQRTAAISIWISCFMSGMALGPVIGGLLLESFWWGSVFLLAVPVMTLMLAAAPFVLPEYRDERAGRLDLLSVGLCLATILPLVYGFKQVASHGYAPESIIALAAGAAVGVVFVRRQLTVDEPLINIRLFQNRAFTTTLLAILISTAAGGGLYLLASQYLQLVQGLSPLHAGLWLIPTGIASIIGALAAPRLATRFGAGTVVAGGLLVAVAGYILLALARADTGIALVATGIALVFFGSGPISALGADIVVNTVPPEKAGSAASMSETSTELGISFGVAILGSLSSIIYRRQIVLPDHLSTPAQQTSRESLSGATDTAQQVSETTATALIESAHNAFTAGLNTTAIIAAITIALLTVAMPILTRQRKYPPKFTRSNPRHPTRSD
ncbi:DHA2 family multidrug resistance protein-like MFS transporter [Naumannella cuiyingiana]|uniref:DHA2 family multidrug resistance protein-like MFS transporter n=1 Tax=Naumannella cuiyingiana TaxID=1347891 RepID=A0A7Z0IKY4_9ACTN|nr:DHA2 family multidrug resistance protein-like MFS transporter [Naumannella cuiyingiana]